MSKIFNALNKAQGEIASLALPLIDGAGGADFRSNKDLPQNSCEADNILNCEPKQLRVEELHLECTGRIVFYTHPNSHAADRYRLLRMRLREFWTAGKLKSILITSAVPGEGKSTTALNLATALAEERSRTVLLVDADLHRGSLNQQLALKPHVGLTECLQNRLNPFSAIRRVEPFGWYFLSSGKVGAANPTELLQPQELATLFQRLSSHFDWVVVDSPPVLPLSDAVALRQHVDGTVLVARAGCTSSKDIEDAIALVERKHIVSLVLNGIDTLHHSYSSYYEYNSNNATSKL